LAKKKEHINTDEELLALFYSSEDTYWIGVLLQRYTLLLLGVCLKYLKDMEDAKDAVQQIDIKIITELYKHKVQNFKAWLFIVARNYCLMECRKNRGKRKIEITENLIVTESDVDDKGEQWLMDVTQEMLEESIMELNEAQRKCVDLFYLQQKSYKDIMALTGFDFKEVKTHIQNGKRNLKTFVIQKVKQYSNSKKNNLNA